METLRAQDALEACNWCISTWARRFPNIRDIERGLRECARFYENLITLGAPIDTVDVGGGLGIDYQGTRRAVTAEANYSMREYARNVVSAFAELCEESHLPNPHLISESGRALTAHHAVLITNVVGAAH